MKDLSLQREILAHTVVVMLRKSERQVHIIVTTPGRLVQHEAMDVGALLSGGMGGVEVLEHVLDLVAAWLEDGAGASP